MNACPVCLSEKKEVRFQVPGAIVSKCKHCSHSFSHDMQAIPSETYDEAYFNKHHENWFKYPNYALFEKIAKTISKEFGKKDVSILDVGCGNGDFLKYLHQKGFNQLTGLDFSENEHPSINFIQGNVFEKNEVGNQKFDVVVSLATIEHVEDIRSFLSIIYSLARPGGLICIMTMDENSWIYRLARTGQKAGIRHGTDRLYDKHHVNHFSKSSLRNLMKFHSGFQIIEHYALNFPVDAIDLPKSIPDFPVRLMIKFLFFLTDLLKKGQFLQVISVKARP